jgi:NADH-quinone oxidoreductase subunit C
MTTEAAPEGTQQSAEALAASPAEHNIAVVRLRAAFPEHVIRAVSMFGSDWAIVPPDLVVGACTLLRNDPETNFTMLVDITATDLLPREPRWEIVYGFLSIPRNTRFRLKVEIGDGPDPLVPSVSSVFHSANWYEREIYDLMGIRFSDHPDPRRILLPEDWQGFPLRFDHPLGGEEVGFTS